MSELPCGAAGKVRPPGRWRQAALALLLLLLPSAASPERGFWEEPAYADRPLMGPGRAKGVVVYNHGNDDVKEEHKLPVQPYVRLLAEDGWDVIKFSRLRAVDDVRRAEDALVAEVQSLRRRGYGRIVLAGPSRGGFLALMAATRVPVHAVIATAPGGFGTRGDGERRSLDELKARLPRILPGTRVLVADFAGDPRVENVGGRGAALARALAGHRHLVLDRPAGFPGHAAAMTGRFARVYGDCLLLFVSLPELPTGFSCSTASGPAVAADLPLPKDLAEPPQRGLLGRWVGIYRNGDARLLVVTRDDGARVEAVWAWAAGGIGKPEREPGFEALSCTRTGATITCPRKAGVAHFRTLDGKRLNYQWFPRDPKARRLTMEMRRPGQW